MSDTVKVSKFKLLVHIVIALLPFICVIYGAYFGYFKVYKRNQFNKTYEDIKYINKNVRNRNPETYKNFDNLYVSLSDILPFDIVVDKQVANTNMPLIKNRFGGNMFFYEGLNSEAERTLYYALVDKPSRYKEIYPGVTSYIILLTELSKFECQTLATHDWSDLVPNYIGIEVSSLENNQIYNGFTKLKTSFIPDTRNDALYAKSIKDQGYISRYPLTEKRAEEQCSCFLNTCTFAIKLR